jgi:hypothetical protein
MHTSNERWLPPSTAQRHCLGQAHVDVAHISIVPRHVTPDYASLLHAHTEVIITDLAELRVQS